jgi:thiamine-monophosphate kinase
LIRAGSSEFLVIDSFLRPFGKRRDAASSAAAGVIAGPGDDCAVLKRGAGFLVATTDAIVERVHFDFRYAAPEDAGHKGLAVNLSDLAAAGAQPRWFLCALGVPRSSRDAPEIALRMARGMAPLARRHGVELAGGNVTSAEQWSITITALGESPRPLSRKGGKPGDALVVCGRLGAAAQGLRDLQGGRRTKFARAQLRPQPLVDEGRAAAGIASAAIDVSDGLLADLDHLCRASRCGARVDVDALPAAGGRELALTGGEDYALLFAVRPARVERLRAAVRTRSAVIGSLTRGRRIELIEGGRPRPLPARLGWDHLGEQRT